MNKLIDTHAHIYLPEFDADRDAMVQRALQNGVEQIFLPNIDADSIASMMELAAAHPSCKPMMGLHPCSVTQAVDEELAWIGSWLSNKEITWFGVGECGLDYYWDTTFKAQQQKAFDQHILWAKQYQLPLIIHSRNATDDCIDMVAARAGDDLRGIFHCFSGTTEQLDKVISLGFMAGIGGVATYKNGGLDKVLQPQHLPYLVLETDAPYLTPVPFRGKRNEPSYLTYVVARLAEILGLPVDVVAQTTTANAQKLFYSKD